MKILTVRCPHCGGNIYSEVYQKKKEYFCLWCAAELNPEMMAAISRSPTSKERWETRKGYHPLYAEAQRQQRLPQLLSVA